MSLQTDIYAFFNEEDRRGKSDSPRREAPTARSFATLPDEMRRKSGFLEGYVHQIAFKNIVSGQNRSYYVIYRKITKEEYDKIKKNVSIDSVIIPTSEKANKNDVYYTPITSYNRTPKGSVEPKNFESRKFIYLAKDDLDKYKKKYPEAKALELVPIKDIYEKGIGVRNVDFNDYIDQVGKEKKASAEKQKEKEKSQQNITQTTAEKEKSLNADKFFSGENSAKVDKIIKKIEFNYNTKTTGLTKQEEEEINKKYDKALEDLNNQILSYTEDENVRNRIVLALKDKFKNSPEIYNDFVEIYKGAIDKEDILDKEDPKKDDKVDVIKKDTKADAIKKEPVKKSKESDPSIDNVISAKSFFNDKSNTVELNNAIKNYSSYIESENDKLDQAYFEKEYRQNVIAYIKKLFAHSKSDKVRKYVISYFVKEKLDSLTDDDRLYNTFKTTYKKYMEYTANNQKNLTEDKKSAPKYKVKVLPGSFTDKEFTKNGVPKVFGTKDTYIRNLTQKQVKDMLAFRNEKGEKEIIDIVPADPNIKGYTSPSSNIKYLDKTTDTTFDVNNPEDIKKLVGKVKPGEKIYSVTIKYDGSNKGKDAQMTPTQIKSLAPDFKFDTKNPQPFETKKYRTRSKDTGKDIYDTVKGTIFLNYLEPIQKGKEFKPAKFFVVDMSDKKIVKGFGTEQDAKKYADELGGYPNTVLDKVNLDKFNIDIKDTKPSDKKTDDKPKYDSKKVDKFEPEKKPGVKGDTLQTIEKEPVDIKNINKLANFKVNTGKYKTSELPWPFYVVDTKNKKLVKGFTSLGKAKEYAAKKGDDHKAYQKQAISGLNLSEALSKEDITKLKSNRVSFTIQSALDPDKQFNISDNVREVKEEKGKVILVLAEAGIVTFDKEGTGVFKYSKDNKEYQALNVPSDLNSIVKKALAPKEDKKEPESQLESYIRKRVRQAIKEAEVSQYWGYQGKDVKKKRLEEYLKRYEWGFQDSDNPYTHSNGSAIHAIVSKLVHELAAMGVDAIAIFNSYAPKGYQVSDLNQLDYASDSPLGSQLTQPYNPDSLTARGGRVAEDDHIRMPSAIASKTNAEKNVEKIEKLVKDMSPQLKDAILKKGNAKNAEGLINTFKSLKDIDKDFDKNLIYNMIKNSNK
jgi:hypothetical protein